MAESARYTPAIDVDAVTAIDVHVHVERDAHGHLALDQELMFGSDYPLITPDRWMADAAELGWPAAVLPAIHKGTAACLLGLG